jgi:uncharacterized protein YjbI with pentapeptide repeats
VTREGHGARKRVAQAHRRGGPRLGTHPCCEPTAPHFRNVEIDRSRFGSADLSDTRVEQLVVTGSKLGWVNLRASHLRDVVFRDCTFEELDLSGAQISRMAFVDCTAGKLALSRSTSRHLDLRGLRFDGVDGPEGLRGATLSGAQLAVMAGMFAEHFGIRVED